MSESTRNLNKDLKPFDYRTSNPMSHAEALEKNAVELYVLRHLTPDEEQRFEEHYFECQECASDVAVEQAQLVPQLAVKIPREPWWRRLALPFWIPITAALSGLVVFQHSELSAPVLAANTPIVAQQAVMGGPSEAKAVTTPSVTIDINLPPDEIPAHFYRVVIMGEGEAPLSQILEAPQDSRLSLQVQRRLLGSGSYNVMVYGRATQDGKDGPQIGQYYFNIH